MKRLWIQYIILILCAGILLAVFPLFTDQIQLANADVDWQADGYINDFGDKVVPIPPPDSHAAASSDDTVTSLEGSAPASALPVSSNPLSSNSSSSKTSSKAATVDPAVSTVPLPPVSSKSPVSSKQPQSSVPTSSSQASVSSAVSSIPPAPGKETVYINEGGKAVQYYIADLLPQIVEAEIGGGSPVEAIKAQAIAAHTFVRYYNDIEKDAPAVSKKAPTEKVKTACAQVLNKLITVNGEPVYTPYCAATAGRTNSSAEVWGGMLSHLQSVESKYDSEDKKNWNTTKSMPVDSVKSVLQSKTGITVTGEPSTWLERINYTAGGYNKNMKICGQTTYQSDGKTVTITGRVIRESILSLKSAWFTWEIQGTSFIFTTRGYGHGVGLSQMGAIGYANHGWNYEKILTHYYTGIKITTI